MYETDVTPALTLETAETANKEKMCVSCGITKPLSEFSPHNLAKDGYRSRCKDCCRKNVTERWAKASLPSIDNHPAALEGFTPKELIDELKRRGYRGTLTYIIRKEIIL